ncbi:MAG: hypothetical protein IH621_11335, partial [Krumholzibacteria bacterium]|nr:hypothetical protein [Candidatus Krumholzibacteria bacterium]
TRRSAARPLAAVAARLQGQQVRLRLLDPARLLERGYSLTLGPDGRVLRRAGDAAPGDLLTTRLTDGELESIVQPGGHAGPPRKPRTRRKAKTRGGNEEDGGQETLFR